mmetsp:Transcript_20482/g.56789  ORF Transcript_20482/g.56789 Transcript_20482/m.56789 type:complete len:154 (-) Transcript_20482:363-824(-)|eukprot:CAMPEP_0117671398 /NCGR_PEP_ID=MMETSP0804-20121206/13311_1 /TAXON_ID=1074897 /ORGANISM="Tetraselmis astigmatica, Strain CCMP880" /LENGTH=153 /DNA_ID=CAMNT_0005479853 /DNA_START=260 /DNA_END=721 /DNA_ORIENTATION=+
MADTLPFSDAEATEKLRQEYLDKSRSGSAEAADACFRYAWALCHSADHRQNKEGVSLTETALAAMPDDRSQNDISAREFKYIQAVALFKMREFSRARHVCNEILEESPACRQAETLKALSEDALVKEGLIGVGVAGVAGLVIAGIVTAAFKGR